MITEISLHGTANEKIDYHVTVTCADFSNRYFHESLPEGDRFFSGPNEFVISRSGVRYNGTGGSLCEYMFAVDLPLKDLLRKDVANRLVTFGAYYGTDETITFTNTTAGEESFDEVFLSGNAVSNYLFLRPHRAARRHQGHPARTSSRPSAKRELEDCGSNRTGGAAVRVRRSQRPPESPWTFHRARRAAAVSLRTIAARSQGLVA